MAKLGKRLKNLRKKNNQKKQELADLLQVSERTYSYYESDERQPSITNIEKLSEHFNVSIDYLLGRTKDPQGSFADEFVKLEKNAFYKTFGDFISEVIDAVKKSVKEGRKQANLSEIIEGINDAAEAEIALHNELEKILKIADVKVTVHDMNAPFCMMEVKVEVSWPKQMASDNTILAN